MHCHVHDFASVDYFVDGYDNYDDYDDVDHGDCYCDYNAHDLKDYCC